MALAFAFQIPDANLWQAVTNKPSDEFIQKILEPKSFSVLSVVIVMKVVRTTTSPAAITFEKPFTNMPF